MNREGMGMALQLVIVGVVLLILSLIVIGGAQGGIGDFNLFTRDNIHSSSINTCASKVKGFCSIDGNDGKDWTKRYPECQKYAAEIATPDGVIDKEECQSGS